MLYLERFFVVVSHILYSWAARVCCLHSLLILVVSFGPLAPLSLTPIPSRLSYSSSSGRRSERYLLRHVVVLFTIQYTFFLRYFHLSVVAIIFTVITVSSRQEKSYPRYRSLRTTRARRTDPTRVHPTL